MAARRLVRVRVSVWADHQVQSLGVAAVYWERSLASGGFALYTNKLAWPGQGSAFPGNDDAGYPPFWPWKEEGVVGNNWVNAMIDANGNYFDLYFPGAGGVQGVSTKNEGYVDGPDTFPALLPPDNRGQMHLNQVLTGIRVAGTTYWMSNQNGVDYSNLSQAYSLDSNTIVTSQRLVAGGNNILVEQADFAPKGVAYPGGGILRGMVIKRMRLTNQSASGVTANVYMYMDPALNGGDIHDSMFTDAARGAMVAFDNTYRIVTGTGAIGPGQEYNPTTFGGYEKNVSCYLAAAMKVGPVGGAGGSMSPDRWSDTSGDTDRGWIGQQVTTAGRRGRCASCSRRRLVRRRDGHLCLQPVIDWFQLGVGDLLCGPTRTGRAGECDDRDLPGRGDDCTVQRVCSRPSCTSTSRTAVSSPASATRVPYV
jgi:hypothetical protein